MKKISIILIFLFGVSFSIFSEENSSEVFFWNHISSCINGQANLCTNTKIKVKKELCAYVSKLKYLCSFNPPKMIFENSIVFAIVSYIMFKALGITLNDYKDYAKEVTN